MAVIAGAGWLLDAAVYLTLATLSGHVFVANMLGNLCGIAFTFTLSSKHAFHYRGTFLYRQFAVYALFALSMMPVFSALLSWMYHAGWLDLLGAKIAVTIPSFIANYLCLKYLFKTRLRHEVSHG